ncbi:MAG: ABC transporter permease subunit [Oscillospiraceae bacterium]|jgi:NitT/TauT family transport system permease protein|nr:ABC transporter permease subunit [Oscillospiraceae bacterium]
MMETVAANSAGVSSIWELRQIEARPKSRRRLAWERALTALPAAALVLVLLQYKLAPNFKTTSVYRTTDIYTWFISAALACALAYFAASLASRRVYERLTRSAPIYTAVALLFLGYDRLTLKSGVLPLPYFPWPDKVLSAMYEDRVMLLDCVKNSLVLLFSGYLTGAAAGLVTGITAGLNKTVLYWVSPLIKVLGPIPSTTWVPIVLILATSLFGGSVFLIALGVWYPVTMTSLNGIQNIRPANFEVARTMGAGRLRLIFKVAIPSAMPHIFQGLTQGMSMACAALMVAEMMGVESGLGWYINWQRGWAEFAKMYSAIIVICLTFTFVNAVLTQVKRRALRWQEGGAR